VQTPVPWHAAGTLDPALHHRGPAMLY
jgi:hypothetical protein